MSKRRGLGKGLGSLIPVPTELESKTEGLETVSVQAIKPNPQQPRSSMDETKLTQLANSIREHGLIQPIIVTRSEDNVYTLIAGERRWRAAKLAGLEVVPVVVKEATPQSRLELALIENIQRDDLNALEEALAYDQLISDFGLTQEDVARRVGKSRSTIANMVRLLNLPQAVQSAIIDGDISGAHARALLPLVSPETQTAVMRSIITRGLSVRQVEAIVKKLNAGAKPEPKPKPTLSLSPEMVDLEARLAQSLGTKVNIQQGKKGGKVVIHYFSNEELQAIFDSIVNDI